MKHGKRYENPLLERDDVEASYRDRDFFDIQRHVDETRPLAAQALDSEQKQMKATLQGVIDEHDRLRSG
jgi:hypothetical protein